MTSIEGTGFENLHFYTTMTGSTGDDEAFARLVDQIMASLPEGVTKDDVMDAINEAIANHPDAPMDEILEEAVETINQAYGLGTDDAAIQKLHSAWETFKSESGLSEDDISAILADPISMIVGSDSMNESSVKQLLAMLYLLMIEIAGEESANQLFEGCKNRDEIMEIAKQKAEELRTKAWVNFATQMTAAVIQVGAGFASMGAGVKGMNAAKAGNSDLAHAYGAQGAAYGAMGQGLGGGVNAIGGVVSGHIDASIAALDGKSQVASTNMDIANKMRQKATELIQSLLNMLQAMSQSDYQTMTAIGRA